MTLTLNLVQGRFAGSLSPSMLATGWTGTESGVDQLPTFGEGNGGVGGCKSTGKGGYS